MQTPSQEGPCPVEPACYGHENKGWGGKWRRKGTCPGPPNSQELAQVCGLGPPGTGHTVPLRVHGGHPHQPKASSDIALTGIYQHMKTHPRPGCHFGRAEGLALSCGCCLGIWKRPLTRPQAGFGVAASGEWGGWGSSQFIWYSCNLASTLSQF